MVFMMMKIPPQSECDLTDWFILIDSVQLYQGWYINWSKKEKKKEEENNGFMMIIIPPQSECDFTDWCVLIDLFQ